MTEYRAVELEELSGWRLDYAVLHYVDRASASWVQVGHTIQDHMRKRFKDGTEVQYTPSQAWADAGPLITMYGISIVKGSDGYWTSRVGDNQQFKHHQPLVAAMRALLASELSGPCEVPFFD